MHPSRGALRLVLASNNAGKLAELRQLFAGLALEIVAQGELGIAEAAEPHATFVENALAKARHAAAASGAAAIADDSGLCVDALGGAPGVASAVFAGDLDGDLDGDPNGDVGDGAADAAGIGGREQRRRAQDGANNALLLARLAGVADRRACFVSTLVALRHAADPEPLIASARWHGRILEQPRGQGGFGYDPLLFIEELDATVAELAPALKNRHSHRAQAAALMRSLLRQEWRL